MDIRLGWLHALPLTSNANNATSGVHPLSCLRRGVWRWMQPPGQTDGSWAKQGQIVIFVKTCQVRSCSTFSCLTELTWIQQFCGAAGGWGLALPGAMWITCFKQQTNRKMQTFRGVCGRVVMAGLCHQHCGLQCAVLLFLPRNPEFVVTVLMGWLQETVL